MDKDLAPVCKDDGAVQADFTVRFGSASADKNNSASICAAPSASKAHPFCPLPALSSPANSFSASNFSGVLLGGDKAFRGSFRPSTYKSSHCFSLNSEDQQGGLSGISRPNALAESRGRTGNSWHPELGHHGLGISLCLNAEFLWLLRCPYRVSKDDLL